MSQLDSTKNFLAKNGKLIRAIAIAVVALLFIGSILIAIFSGGELKSTVEASAIKGLFRLDEAKYDTGYIVGDKFAFDKESSKILLVAKDPALDNKVVKVDNLPGKEYGFKVNGEGEIYENASDITMTADVHTVDVVSKQYPDLTYTIPVNVYASIDTNGFTDAITMEAENADLYSADGKLITQEEKATLPDTNKPYLSNKGDTLAGENCSGGACIRNFSSGMKMEFRFASSASTDLTLTLKLCRRPDEVDFDTSVTTVVNGREIKTEATVPEDANGGYYALDEIQFTVHIERGLNVISFTANSSTCNMDAIVLSAPEGSECTFGPADAVGELVNEIEEPEEQPSEEEPAEEQPAKDEETAGE